MNLIILFKDVSNDGLQLVLTGLLIELATWPMGRVTR